MQSARGLCRGGESIASPPTIPVARGTHDLSDAAKLHVENCVDSLTLRCEFMVHNSMAVKKTPINMTLIFDLLFRDFFGLGESLCFHSVLCDFS